MANLHPEAPYVSDKTYYYILTKHYKNYLFSRKCSVGRCDDCVHLAQQRVSTMHSSDNER